MNNENIFSAELHKNLFAAFVQKAELQPYQAEQFRTYLIALLEWNQKFNITAITSIEDVLNFHFRDSLSICAFLDLNTVSMVCDVGSGGGFPGIPLKIKSPHLNMKLIE